MKPWVLALIAVLVAVPVGALFFIATAVGAAWGGPDISPGLGVWFVGWLLAGTALYGFRQEQDWGRIVAIAGSALLIIAAIIAVVATGRPQPLLFALPAAPLLAAAWMARAVPE